jgi:cell division protein FtsQ
VVTVSVQVPPNQSLQRSAQRLGRMAAVAAALLVLAFVAAGAWDWLAAPERFPLTAVRLDTRLAKVGESELREAILPHLDKGLLGLDVERIRLAIEALPWVESATVRRRWPGALVINAHERVAVARWNDGLMSERGALFRPRPETFPPALPLLEGPADSAVEVWARFQRLSAILSRAGLGITMLRLDERQAWTATLTDGVILKLGVDAADAAAERFVQAFPRIGGPAETRLVRVDLRYPNGFALAWSGDGAQSPGNRKQ